MNQGVENRLVCKGGSIEREKRKNILKKDKDQFNSLVDRNIQKTKRERDKERKRKHISTLIQ